MGTQDVELIPSTPTLEIILRTEEIPPLDVFCSPTHKFFVKRKRNKIKLDVAAIMTPDNEAMDLVWKDSPMDPYKKLKKLLQFTRAYVKETIDKEIEVQMLLREKEQNILRLEQQLAQKRYNQQVEFQVAKLQHEFEQMEIQHHASLVERDVKNTSYDR